MAEVCRVVDSMIPRLSFDSHRKKGGGYECVRKSKETMEKAKNTPCRHKQCLDRKRKSEPEARRKEGGTKKKKEIMGKGESNRSCVCANQLSRKKWKRGRKRREEKWNMKEEEENV